MSDLIALRTALLEQAASLTSRVAKIESHLRGVDRDAPDDWTDRAQFLENDAVLEALDEHDRAQLEAIRGALSRIEAGTWGECSGCGEEIPEGRLAAIPTTSLCVSCAT